MARRSGLGKGLAALIPGEEGGDGDGGAPEGLALLVVPIESIRPNPYQPRSHFDDDSLSELAASIGAVGVLQPVLVRPVIDQDDAYELIAGERRWRAARRAGLDMIPAIIHDKTTDLHSLEVALVENLHRSDLNATGGGSRLPAADRRVRPHSRAGRRAGEPRAATGVTNTLRLLQLPARRPARGGRGSAQRRARQGPARRSTTPSPLEVDGGAQVEAEG